MPSLSDFIVSSGGAGGGGILPWNVIDDATGSVALDYSQHAGYKIKQGSADLTLNFNTDPTIYMPAGKLAIQINKDFSFAVNDSNIDSILLYGAPEISNAELTGAFAEVESEDNTPNDVFFKLDGTKMYVIAGVSDSVFQYSLSTEWNLSTASYDNVSLDVSTEETSPTGLFFKSDGTKMYMIGRDSDSIHQYTLTTAWDLSTASYDSVFYDASGEDFAPTGLFIKSDGTKLYITGNGGDVNQYTLSTAWDLSTISYDNISFPVGASSKDVFFNSTGELMYSLENFEINQYTLLTPWDVSTASFDLTFDTGAVLSFALEGIFFKPDESKMYVTGAELPSGSDTAKVHEFLIFDRKFALNDVFQFGPDISIEEAANQTNVYK